MILTMTSGQIEGPLEQASVRLLRHLSQRVRTKALRIILWIDLLQEALAGHKSKRPNPSIVQFFFIENLKRPDTQNTHSTIIYFKNKAHKKMHLHMSALKMCSDPTSAVKCGGNTLVSPPLITLHVAGVSGHVFIVVCSFHAST